MCKISKIINLLIFNKKIVFGGCDKFKFQSNLNNIKAHQFG